jgi:hypothetical protein
MEPNIFGKIIFFIWPLVIFWFFKKKSIKEAIFLSVAISSILLPAAYALFDLPLLPELDRDVLTVLTILIILFINKQKNPIFKSGGWGAIFIAYILTIIVSSIINSDELLVEGVYLNASKPYDALSNVVIFVVSFMPFILGRNFLNNPKDTEFIFKTMTILALVYTIPMAYEIRLSPQLHSMFYGYFPFDFMQQIRSGGFRPVVFIGHGLTLAFWYSTCLIAALVLYKNKIKVNRYFGFMMLVYLTAILVLCKTVSAIVYLLFAFLLMYLFKIKKQLILTLVLVLVVFVYPFNAATQFVKNSDVLEFVRGYSDERGDSLQTRFENEERLMERALERPLFGWAGWGRSRVYRWGKDITVTDGQWIMQFGVYGALGFVFYYMMLVYPIILAIKNYRFITDEKQKSLYVGLAIILAVGIFDSIPNTGMMPIHLLLAGALLGQSEFLSNSQKQLIKKSKRF